MIWEKTTLRSWRGVPPLIWLFYIVPAVCGTLILIGVFFGYSLQNTIYVGFGTPSLSAVLPWSNNLQVIQAALVANTPQLLASYIYVGCNAVLTGMWSHEELLHYARAITNVLNRQRTADTQDNKQLSRRKSKRQDRKHEKAGPQALRVTQPRGGQRETYYLTLPWLSSIPLLLASIALHWLVAESLFLLRVEVVDTTGTQAASNVITTVGYSSGPILAIIVMLVIQLLTIIGIGIIKKHEMTMPIAGTCSAAIAAISQPAVDENGSATFDKDIYKGKLYWGVVGNSKTASSVLRRRRQRQDRSEVNQDTTEADRHTTDNEGDEADFDQYQHATFSAGEVEPLIEGRLYA